MYSLNAAVSCPGLFLQPTWPYKGLFCPCFMTCPCDGPGLMCDGLVVDAGSSSPRAFRTYLVIFPGRTNSPHHVTSSAEVISSFSSSSSPLYIGTSDKHGRLIIIFYKSPHIIHHFISTSLKFMRTTSVGQKFRRFLSHVFTDMTDTSSV